MSRNNNQPPPQNQSNGRNEYIPQFISAKPFYAEDLLEDSDYLQHQRSKAEQKDTIDKAKWYDRGAKGPAATKYRKGACENCGAITHKTKECLSRKRKIGAKWTGRDIQADERVTDVKLGWDAKRDRWNGYDVREYDGIVKDYEEMERLRKETDMAKSGASADPDAEAMPDDGDGDHYAEETDMGRSQPTSTRQLRLREDTAKYLVNLDLDSAKYDPKTRSMDTTEQALNERKAGDDIASEGFVRPSHDPRSDAAAFEKAQRYAWETSEKPATPSGDPAAAEIQKGSIVHLEANPTASALAHKKHQVTLQEKKMQQKAYLNSKYGDTTANTQQNRPIASVTATSSYTTYDPETGREIDQATGKPLLKPVARSKYPEDVYPGNHSSVFGSWWRSGKWGYQCCHSFVKNSYCTGEDGRKAFEEEEAQRLGRHLITENTGLDDSEDHGISEAVTGIKRKAEQDEDGDSCDAKRGKTEEPV